MAQKTTSFSKKTTGIAACAISVTPGSKIQLFPAGEFRATDIRPKDASHCDPPYWGTEGYGVEFGLEQYDQMAELAESIRGKMVISVNDIPEMRKAFKGMTMETVKINHTVGGQQGRGQRSELVIRNF